MIFTSVEFDTCQLVSVGENKPIISQRRKVKELFTLLQQNAESSLSVCTSHFIIHLVKIKYHIECTEYVVRQMMLNKKCASSERRITKIYASYFLTHSRFQTFSQIAMYTSCICLPADACCIER